MIRRLVARYSTSPPVEALRRAAWTVGDLLQQENHDLWRNGERRLVELLGSSTPLLLDVGAESGRWTAMALTVRPEARVHALEISAHARDLLRDRFEGDRRVIVASAGLDETPGEVMVKRYERSPAWTSLHDYPHTGPFTWVRERVRRGDEYLKEAGLDRVDLLKIDAEGHDLAILRSFGSRLDDGSLPVIQFEYGYAAVLSGALLARFFELLEPRGYVLARLRARDCVVRPYHVTDERFFGPNYIAVHSSEPGLLRRLGRR